MYKVKLIKQAVKSLEKLNSSEKKRFYRKLKRVAEDPYRRNPNVKRLTKPLKGYRLRIGDLRVLYTLDDEAELLRVYKIGFRGSIY